MSHLNPKSGQGDGAGFGRLRAAQQLRETFAENLRRTHPSCLIYIDQVREYAGAQVVFYRAKSTAKSSMSQFEYARVAIFKWRHESNGGEWRKESDMIANHAS
jgi:hypothetical protein